MSTKRILVGVTILTSALLLPTAAHARTELRCRRLLFFEFSCKELKVEYQLTKKVRLSGKDEFQDRIDPVLNTQEMIFRIEVTNNGDAQDKNLKITDTLPQNLDFVSSDNMQQDKENEREIHAQLKDKLKPGQTQTFTYVAQANLKGINPGEKRCVTNNAVLYRDENNDDQAQQDEIEGNESTTICILNQAIAPQPTPTPSFPTQLPNSAAGDLDMLLTSLTVLGLGTLLSRRVRFSI